MYLRKILTSLAAMLVIGVVFASVAHAAAETKVGGWVTGVVLGVGESATTKCASIESLTLESTVLGTPITIHASGLECPSSKVEEVESSGKMAEFHGQLKFTGVTVATPGSCSITGGSITASSIVGRIQMAGSTPYLVVTPTTGTVLAEFEFSGGSCALAGSLVALKGTLDCLFNPTGSSATGQVVAVSPSIETAAGGSLTIGKTTASLTGRFKIELTTGEVFKVEESPVAPAKTISGQWYVKGTKLAVEETRTVKCSAAENFFIRGVVARVPLELKATGLECLSGKIKEAEHPEGIMAEKTGELKFTGLTVVQPSGCKIASTLTLAPYASRVYMGGTNAYTIYRTASGPLATIKLESCTAEGSYTMEGNLFGKNSTTGTSAEAQPATFSEEIQNGAEGSLLIGGEIAQVSGKLNEELTEGGAWKVEEK